MRQLILFIISAFFLFISSKKYASFISGYYAKKDTSAVATIPAIKIMPGMSSAFDSVARVDKGDTYFIPALFYWGVKQSFACELNAHLPTSTFINTFYRYADSSGLNNKINGQRLEITIDSMPNRFLYSSKQDIIFLVLYAVTITNQSVYPHSNSLAISYKLYHGGTVTKQGKIVVENNEQAYTNNVKSTRKVTWIYLNQYERNMRMLTRQCISKLVNEL
jgi:hypothetical protein